MLPAKLKEAAQAVTAAEEEAKASPSLEAQAQADAAVAEFARLYTIYGVDQFAESIPAMAPALLLLLATARLFEIANRQQITVSDLAAVLCDTKPETLDMHAALMRDQAKVVGKSQPKLRLVN